MSHGMLYAVAIAGALLAGCVGSPRVGESESALGFPNDEAAFDFFVQKGLTEAQSAGIVGNLDVESGVNPSSVQSGGPGRGIAQWSVGARWDTTYHDNTTWYAAQQGQGLLTLSLQLEFIWYELNHDSSYGLAQLEATTTVSGATLAFSKYFEGCGTCNNSIRVTDAQHVYATFKGTTGHDLATAPGVCVLANGDTGTCIDTTVCNGMSGHVASPGFCAGASNIQCCTLAAVPPPDGDAATGPVVDASVIPDSTDTDGGLDAKSDKGCSVGGDPRTVGLGVFASLLVLIALRRKRTT